MKNAMPVLGAALATILLIAVIALLVISRSRQVRHVTVRKGNVERVALPMELNHFQDTQCGMTIEQEEDTAQAVAPDGKTWFFDDVGCLALWYADRKGREDLVLWVFTRDSAEWLDARQMWYSRTDKTPMNYGFAAYRDSQAGFIHFEEVVPKMLRGENLSNPYIRKELLGQS